MKTDPQQGFGYMLGLMMLIIACAGGCLIGAIIVLLIR